jgi:hypothetical protein
MPSEETLYARAMYGRKMIDHRDVWVAARCFPHGLWSNVWRPFGEPTFAPAVLGNALNVRFGSNHYQLNPKISARPDRNLRALVQSFVYRVFCDDSGFTLAHTLFRIYSYPSHGLMSHMLRYGRNHALTFLLVLALGYPRYITPPVLLLQPSETSTPIAPYPLHTNHNGLPLQHRSPTRYLLD